MAFVGGQDVVGKCRALVASVRRQLESSAGRAGRGQAEHPSVQHRPGHGASPRRLRIHLSHIPEIFLHEDLLHIGIIACQHDRRDCE